MEADEALERCKRREDACWVIIGEKTLEIERLRAELSDSNLAGTMHAAMLLKEQEEVKRLRAELAELKERNAGLFHALSNLLLGMTAGSVSSDIRQAAEKAINRARRKAALAKEKKE